MKRAANLEEKRNQITHSVWAAGDTADTVTRIKMTAKEKYGIRFKFEKVGKQDLTTIAHDLKHLSAEILEFWRCLIQNGKAFNNPLKKLW
jgi:predicted DsbA family dithiol-disulfide isomerase